MPPPQQWIFKVGEKSDVKHEKCSSVIEFSFLKGSETKLKKILF